MCISLQTLGSQQNTLSLSTSITIQANEHIANEFKSRAAATIGAFLTFSSIVEHFRVVCDWRCARAAELQLTPSRENNFALQLIFERVLGEK